MFEIGAARRVTVSPPQLPSVTVVQPGTESIHLVPVVGPQGPPGAPGEGSGDLGLVADLIDDAIEEHIDSPEPHPVYDDLPSLTLIFNNGLV